MNLFPEAPQVTFRRAKTLKNVIAPSKLKTHCRTHTSDIPSYFNNRTGIFQCKRWCLTCQFIYHRKQSLSDKGQVFTFRQFITCSSVFVIYVLRCPFGLLYVGRTIRTLRKRVGEHRLFIHGGCDKQSVPRHYLLHHYKDIKCLKVMVIEYIFDKTLTTNEKFALLCKREAVWIF